LNQTCVLFKKTIYIIIMTTIYSLKTVEKDTCYINEVSYSKMIIEHSMCTHPDDEKILKFAITDKVPFYSLVHLNSQIQLFIKQAHSQNDVANVYAFNQTSSENALVDITGFDIDTVRRIPMFHNNLSENPVTFDWYYEDGIMTA
jgi:hypothetical protein